MIKVSALPLLAYKVGPNLFDLSSRMHHVSLRDQMHRAVALSEALVNGNQFSDGDQVLIVGAGVAGVAAGSVLARHGVSVQLVDCSEDAPFALQRQVHSRSVGPYMYEWPLEVHQSQCMPPLTHGTLSPWDNGKRPPLPFSASQPCQPAALVVDWDKSLGADMADLSGQLRLQIAVDKKSTNLSVRRWLAAQNRAHGRGLPYASHEVTIYGGKPWGPSSPPHSALKPRFVLLAAGLGTERNEVEDASGKPLRLGAPFWSDDRILDMRCGLPRPPRVVVLGGGDGALQDSLRAVTGHANPLETWDKLQRHDINHVLPAILERILALETQHAYTIMWAETGPASVALRVLDGAFAALAKEVATDNQLSSAMCGLLRNDVNSVHLCVREDFFSKAYALNRFLVHLIEQSLANSGNKHVGVQFHVHRGVTLKHATASAAASHHLSFTDGLSLAAEIVAVRFGTTSELPGQLIGLTLKDTVNRQELAAVPLPLYLPPTT